MIQLLAICCFLLISACHAETSTTTGEPVGGGGGGGAGGTATDGGAGGSTTSSEGGAGGTSTSDTTTTTPDACFLDACKSTECGFAKADCDGDGVLEHVDCGGCTAPAACLGSNELNKCGTQCLAKAEYTDACGEGVEFACANDGCGFCYKYVNGKTRYKSVGVDCPTVTASDGIDVRCCVPGCGGDC